MNIRSDVLKYTNTAVAYPDNGVDYQRIKKTGLADSAKIVELSKVKDTGSQIKDFFRLQRYINNTIENIQKSYGDIQREMLPSLLKLKEMVFKVVKNDIPLDEKLKIQNEVTEIRTKINEVFSTSGNQSMEIKKNVIKFPSKAGDSANDGQAIDYESLRIPELSVLTEDGAAKAAVIINNLIISVERQLTSLTQKKEESVAKLDEMGTANQHILGDDTKRYNWDEMQKILAYTKQKMFADVNQALEAQGNISYREVIEVLG